jgi:hypothetical protein
MHEVVHKFYVYSMPFYIRDLGIRKFWYPQRSWNISLSRHWKTTIVDTRNNVRGARKREVEEFPFSLEYSGEIETKRKCG